MANGDDQAPLPYSETNDYQDAISLQDASCMHDASNQTSTSHQNSVHMAQIFPTQELLHDLLPDCGFAKHGSKIYLPEANFQYESCIIDASMRC
jgi:hypothetical protein